MRPSVTPMLWHAETPLCAAQLGKRPGSGRHAGCRAPRRREGQRPVHALRRFRNCMSSRIDMPDTKELTALMDTEALERFRARALNPEHPMLRRHRAERRRVLPGARGEQHRLRRAGRTWSRASWRRLPAKGQAASTTCSTTTARLMRPTSWSRWAASRHRAGGMRLFEREGPGCGRKRATVSCRCTSTVPSRRSTS